MPFRTGEFGLAKDSVAQCENIFTVELNLLDFDSGPLGQLDEDTMQKIVRAIGYVMEADCEPV